MVPFVTGSVFLLVIVTMELDPASSFEIRSLPESTMLMFSQIVVCAEFLVVFISLLVYIGKEISAIKTRTPISRNNINFLFYFVQ